MIDPAKLAPLVAVKDCRYGRMMYLTNDGYVGRSLELYGEFSEAEVFLFRQLVRPGSVVCDVGANIGAHTVALASLTGPTGAVLAFEPIRFLHSLLCGNLALNGLTYVKAYHYAVGNAPGTVRVPPIDFTHPDNYGGLALGNYAFGEQVEVIRLDDVLIPSCSLIKVDVEGMEQQVIEGAQGLIARFHPILYVENNGGPKSHALVECIRGLGYELYWHYPPLYNPDNYRHHTEDVFSDAERITVSHNMLCLRAGSPPPRGMEPVNSAPAPRDPKLPGDHQ